MMDDPPKAPPNNKSDASVSLHSSSAHVTSSTGSSAGSLSRSCRSSSIDVVLEGDNNDTHSLGSLRSKAIAPASRNSRKSNQMLQLLDDFTINKLRFHELGMIGRDRETVCLHDGWTRACGKEGTRELILLSGLAGTGKSALARTLQNPTEQRGGMYILGKFDYRRRQRSDSSNNSHSTNHTSQQPSGEPYDGIASACQALCGQLLLLQKKNPGLYKSVQDQLNQELGLELKVLIKIIPALEEIVGDRSVTEVDDIPALSEAKNRIVFAFRQFIRIICGCFSPLVLVLDDLQWTDQASLELLESLVTDSQVTNLLVIGCYRSNEVDDTHLVSKMISNLNKYNASSTENSIVHLTELTVGNFNVTQTNELLVQLLSREAQETQGLAQICHKKTDGNVLFLITYLSMLHDQNLLEYNLGTTKWTWKESMIESQTGSTENVVSILQGRLESLPSNVKELLQVAACLGSSFEASILSQVWRTFGGLDDGGTSVLRSLLDTAVTAGFIETYGLSGYRFVHDKIQEAVLSIVDKKNLRELKAQIGEILVANLDDDVLETQLFIVTNLLNEGFRSSRGINDRIKMAGYNLQAAKKAVRLSAFESASRYALLGIGFLPDDKWTHHYGLTLDLYGLTLDLYSTAAEMHLALRSPWRRTAKKYWTKRTAHCLINFVSTMFYKRA